MKVVYGVPIGRWSKRVARHVDDGAGKPLCGNGRNSFVWLQGEDEPTCKRCLKLNHVEVSTAVDTSNSNGGF